MRVKPTVFPKKVTNPQVIFSQMPFRIWQATPEVMPLPHVHADIEANFLLSGEMRYFLAGRFYDVTPGDLTVFWAGMPHRLIYVAPETVYICLTLPLAWFLSWGVDKNFTHDLLTGGMATAPVEIATLHRWIEDSQSQLPERERIALLEVEATLRRMALLMSDRNDRNNRNNEFLSHTPPSETEAKTAEKIAAFVAERYQDDLTTEKIATHFGIHPHYAMTVFKQHCGLPLWEYVLRLRVSHAQRLLLTTDWTVERIGLACGFGSSRRFFANFSRIVGTTPRRYRT
jgi:AraC family transcriptional regulator, melibiose operon regulatory protein